MSERTTDSRMDSATETFLAHRNLLFTVAYEMLGSAADAEDALQETWLRWVGVDLETVRDRRAVETGDLQRLLDVLAPDVVLLGDGGGVVPAALAPVVGADRVAHVLGRIATTASLWPAQVNGYPALIVRRDGELDTVLAVRLDDGLISGLYAVRNPAKLSRMGRATDLRR